MVARFVLGVAHEDGPPPVGLPKKTFPFCADPKGESRTDSGQRLDREWGGSGPPPDLHPVLRVAPGGLSSLCRRDRSEAANSLASSGVWGYHSAFHPGEVPEWPNGPVSKCDLFCRQNCRKRLWNRRFSRFSRVWPKPLKTGKNPSKNLRTGVMTPGRIRFSPLPIRRPKSATSQPLLASAELRP